MDRMSGKSKKRYRLAIMPLSSNLNHRAHTQAHKLTPGLVRWMVATNYSSRVLASSPSRCAPLM